MFDALTLCAGSIFDYPSRKTWEWTSDSPIRSVFPLWPAYGLPLVLLQWLWPRGLDDPVDPSAIYYTLRVVMFILSFVLEDWAIHELVRSPRYRRQAVVLVASSYVTWTYQTHTFSNSVETLIVLWSLVLIERIAKEEVGSLLHANDRSLICLEWFPLFKLCLGLPACVWHFQPNYFSCFRYDTRHHPAATVLE